MATARFAVVTGASRGLGLELARALLASDSATTVVAVSRDPAASAALLGLRRNVGDRLLLRPVDLRSEFEIAHFARSLQARAPSLELLVNAAGVVRTGGARPEEDIESVDAHSLTAAFAVNAAAPTLMARHLLPLLKASDRAVIANISARIASITDNEMGGWYGYRASKAAQNMLTKTLAIELARRAPNVICVALHPGTTDDDMCMPFQRAGVDSNTTVAPDGAHKLLALIDSLVAEQSGAFLTWDRTPLPW